ncbi:MAG: choline-sulfatase [Myxococcota bacterium]|jgi:choline-sulfatase
MSFLVISMDTFRADHRGALDASGHSLTPNLDALAGESVVFSRAFSQSNETLFSHAALFTGHSPSRWGELSYFSYRLPPDTPTLATTLSRAGYQTEAVVAGGHLSPGFGLTVGFQRYQSMQEFSGFQETVPRARERLAGLSEGSRPFLLFVHGYDAHSPYLKPGVLFQPDAPEYSGEMRELARNPLTMERIRYDRYYPDFQPSGIIGKDGRSFLDPEVFSALDQHAASHPGQPLTAADLAFLQGAYDSAIRSADFFVGVLLAELEQQGLADRTTVVVLSDHGEDLLEHGYFNHRLSLHDESTHVPLLIRVPGESAAVVDDPVALIDVMPSLLALAGLDPPDGLTPPLWEGTDPKRLVFSESLRGEQSWRSRDGRLIARGETVTWLGGEGDSVLSEEATSVLRAAHSQALP